MNIVKIGGEPAAQMFQYAFYLALLEHDPQALLDVPGGKERWIATRFALPRYLVATPEQLSPYGRGTVKSRILGRMLGHKGHVVTEPDDHKFYTNLFDETDTYFDGQWLSPRYFAAVEAQVREAFTVPVRKLPARSASMVNMLSQGKSVAVHVHKPQDPANTCTPDYYNWAIANVLSTYREAHFYVFTTDVAWAKAHIEPQGAKCDFVAYPAESQFTLLAYLCHASHIIMSANLTSWWAAWLGQSRDSIIIAPDRWSKNADYPDLLPESWTTVPTI